MKQNDITNLVQIDSTNMANIFNVYADGNNGMTYSINRTINFVGHENMAPGTYLTYRVNQNDTWHLIAYKAYGDIKLWWLVCKANGITNPLKMPIPGSEIKILKKDTGVPTILNSIRYE